MRHKSARLDVWRSAILTAFFCLSVPLLVTLLVPQRVFHLYRETIFVVGAFGVWRYTWFMVNASRGFWFNWIRYPKMRAQCDALPLQKPGRLYVAVMSYQEQPDTSRLCFHALVRALENMGADCEAVVMASVATEEEALLIRGVVDAAAGPGRVNLHFTQQSQGKRMALGHALRFLRDYGANLEHPDPSQEVVLLMDGDSILGEDIFTRCLPHFRRDRSLGALTTNEAALRSPRWIITQWFRLKFAKRHFYMSSHSLSNKVMTLTGRGSFVRAEIALSDEFIGYLETDSIEHPVHGRIRFLLGDDKSTLYCVLKNRWRLLYVPDAMVYASEDRDEPFLKLSPVLMSRWYGNMLRNNPRCLKLGPRNLGWFMWVCFLDQRISMWTGLVGPLGALILSVYKSFYLLLLYIGWICIIRLAQMSVLAIYGLRLHPVFVPLQMYDQIVGSVIKIHGLFHLAQQHWHKGGRSASEGTGLSWGQLVHMKLSMSVAVTLFFCFLLLVLGVVPVPF